MIEQLTSAHDLSRFFRLLLSDDLYSSFFPGFHGRVRSVDVTRNNKTSCDVIFRYIPFLARVFLFRIPVFWFPQNCTNFKEASVGIVMMVSNTSVAVLSSVIAWIVIRKFKNRYMH